MRRRLAVVPAVVVALVTGADPHRVHCATEDEPSPKADILEIVDSRAARLPAIDRYKAAGVLGENNRGLIEIVDLDAAEDSEARADVHRLVRVENDDRERLYTALASNGENGNDRSRLRGIRAKYAEIMRTNARPGDWIQLPDGTWQRKNGSQD